MKEIHMDFETYEKEMAEERDGSRRFGVMQVTDYINSGKNFHDFFNRYVYEKDLHVWKRLLFAMGREKEWDYYLTATGDKE